MIFCVNKIFIFVPYPGCCNGNSFLESKYGDGHVQVVVGVVTPGQAYKED